MRQSGLRHKKPFVLSGRTYPRQYWLWLDKAGRAKTKLLGVLAALLLAAVLFGSPPARAASDFDNWLAGLRKEALASGISAAVFDSALAGVQPKKRVVELDRSQPEFKLTLKRYLANTITAARVKKGRALRDQHQQLLADIGREYGVQPRYILALWGIESAFGQHKGGFFVPQALATLAYDGRRAAYFRKELLNALKILQEGHIDQARMMGSWAGAMGQPQFMPSSFLAYAEDWNKDGRRDIWTDEQDVFASVAHYLQQAGWRDDITWGREVRLADGPDWARMAKAKTRQTMREWQALGLRTAEGGPLPQRNLSSRLILPDGTGGRAFLAYDNFESLRRWNRSDYFAIAVGILSDYYK
jgi:membrane-bound lytic murein transglycosylase B